MKTSPAEAPAAHDRPRVLVIDDERDVLDTVAAILEPMFEVETCSSPAVARKLIVRERFDVVCTDYQMPTMTGIELLEGTIDEGVVFGVVLLTARYDNCASALKRSDVLHALPIAMLSKPYAPDELIDAIRRASAFGRVRRALKTLARTGATR